MTNQITEYKKQNNVDTCMWNTLKETLYANATDKSVMMVLDYCKAAKLDPMQKPVHIVPMWDKDTKAMKDTIMPSIGLYRIQAARSNKYAGLSEPIYGEIINTTFIKIDKNGNKEDVNISYPEWCKVTVKKLVGDNVVEFTAKEYWLENYAKTNSKSTAPNTMWANRPMGQLAKCAEAQALRKAFPEIVTQQPTAEEMEGKTLKNKEEVNGAKSLYKRVEEATEKIKEVGEIEEKISVENKKTDILKTLEKLITQKNIPEATIESWLNSANVSNLSELDEEKINKCINYIRDKKII